MMSIGIKPTAWNSPLTGLTKRIYHNMINENAIKSETIQTQTISGKTYSEREEDRNNRVLSEKLKAYAIAKSCIQELQANGEVVGSKNITTYIAGVGLNGEQLVAGTYPCVGTVNTPPSSTIEGTILSTSLKLC